MKAQIIIYGFIFFVIIYLLLIFLSMMGLYTEAVTLALDNNNIEIAKSYANKPENDDLKKKLWLQV